MEAEEIEKKNLDNFFFFFNIFVCNGKKRDSLADGGNIGLRNNFIFVGES